MDGQVDGQVSGLTNNWVSAWQAGGWTGTHAGRRTGGWVHELTGRRSQCGVYGRLLHIGTSLHTLCTPHVCHAHLSFYSAGRQVDGQVVGWTGNWVGV